MKKYSIILVSIALILVLAMAFVACGPLNPTPDPAPGPDPDPAPGPGPDPVFGEEYESITIAEAIEIAKSAGSTPTSEKYIIVGTVKEIKNATYGEMTVEDATGELYIYGSMASDGTYFDQMTDRPQKGDKIALQGALQTYKDTPEMGIKNDKAIILAFEHVTPDFDESEYTAHNLASTRALEAGSKVKVSGVVARITYANGMKPSGVIIIDDSASIYVYSADVANAVSIGNKIEVCGEKTYWILDTEQSNAAIYGYKGACQIDNAILISNDKGNNTFDTSWMEQKTVKEIINSDITGNITTLVYETIALIKKVPGTGFTNYYFFDLDGETGAYTYTQCNGSDFGWLDEFDGQICKVYLTALNAKSQPAGCFYRFLPVAVEKLDDFTYPAKDVPAFALEYGVKDLFESVYGGDPALELPSTYANSLLSVDGVEFAYSSSDTTVATVEGGVLHLLKDGSATITVTATYGAHTASIDVNVSLKTAQQITTPTIAEVIAQEDGTLVQVRGIVMSSLVNQSGFYLGDDTGMIAVLASSDTLAQIEPGDEVVFEGYLSHKKAGGTRCIVGDYASNSSNSTLLANYKGENEYSTAYFDTTKTLADLTNLPTTEDYTTNVYVLRATVSVVEAQYYTTIKLVDGDTTFSLYCSSAGQYSWLKQFANQEVEMEIAVCNWNEKSYYTGCVIAVRNADGSKIINTLNFSN